MRSGVLYGNAGMIDSMIQRMEEAARQLVRQLVRQVSSMLCHCITETGAAYASRHMQYCKREILIDENLLLDGLYYLYQKNLDRRRKRGE